jgi:hypothetical protein
MRTRSKPAAYNSVAVIDDVHEKLEIWRRALTDKYNRRVTFSETVDFLLDTVGVPTDSRKFEVVEVVTYDPKDGDTYPSVCVFPDEVRERFGFVGGERLLFSQEGAYIGRITDELEEPQP